MNKSQVALPQGDLAGWHTPFATSAGIRLASIPEENLPGGIGGTEPTQGNREEENDSWEIGWTQQSVPTSQEPGITEPTVQTQHQ
eukprot:3648539-Heterocapsa_arctica.AAC.1